MSTQWRTWFNPSHKLYEPWVRVSWAEHKMATFGLATNIAVHDTAYRFVPDVNHDSQSRGVLTFRCEKVPHLTMEARFLLGELVFHLRVALDHIACALVEEGGGTVTECTGFPIPKLEFSETSGISIKNREVERSIKGASPEAIVAVKNLQPDIDRNTNHFNPAIALAILHEMSISDKHIQTLSLEPQVLVSHARTGKTIFNHLKVDQDGRVDVPQATGRPTCLPRAPRHTAFS